MRFFKNNNSAVIRRLTIKTMKASTKFQQKLGNVSKLNRPIPSSAVGAGFACPKTQSKLFSGERTSPLRTKRQHYPRFDNPFLLYRVTYPFLSLAGRGIFVQRVTTWRMEYGKN